MDLHQVATFLAVVDSGNFGTAAKQRGISQGAVSQQISKLESRLGVRLLSRSPRRCEPTPVGAEFCRHARDLVRLAQRAETAVRQRSVTLGASSNIGIYLIQPYLKAFSKRSNSVLLDIKIASNPQISSLLNTGERDVAVMEWWDNRPGYHADVWRQEALVAIVPPDHPWASLKELPPDFLQGVPLLGGESGTGTGRILAERLGYNNLSTSQQLGSTEAVKQWVKAGLGVSVVLAGTVSEDVADGSLCAIPFADHPPSKNLYVVWRSDLMPESSAHQLVNCLLDVSLV